jgi:hypothetical protein
MRRTATAMLRGLGGTRVYLRVPAPLTGDTNSQLGLSAPASEDVPLFPAVVRKLKPTADGRASIEVMLGSGSMEPAALAHGSNDAATWLLCAVGLLYRGQLMHIDTVMTDHFAGSEYLYHVYASE